MHLESLSLRRRVDDLGRLCSAPAPLATRGRTVTGVAGGGGGLLLYNKTFPLPKTENHPPRGGPDSSGLAEPSFDANIP